MKHIASIIAIPAAAFVAMAFLAGCETPSDAFVSDELVEISGALMTPQEVDANCSFTAADGDKKCDGRTRYKAQFNGPDQPVDTGQTNKKDAALVCGKYAVGNLKPVSEDLAPSCPECPTGTKGCEVSDAKVSWTNLVKTGKTYSCKGDPIKVTYVCSRCKIGKGLCTDIILDGIEISGMDATDLESSEGELSDGTDDSLSKPKPAPITDAADDADGADDADDSDDSSASVKPAKKRARK